MGCGRSREDPAYLEGLLIFRKYDFVMCRGRGATSQVHEAIDKESGQSFAIKCVVKKEAEALGRFNLGREAEKRWGVLEHPNICRLHATYEDLDLEYLVMELCDGGTLFERLEEAIVLEETEAARLGLQMTHAVAHLHDKSICHRDLKPESWLMADNSLDARVKLINFGLAEHCNGDFELTQPCGTLHYLAPEVLRGRYGKPADTWTLGVVLFLALYAAYPFDGESCTSVMQSILGSEPDWSDSCYALSAEARDLLHKLLAKDPYARMTASQAINHKWFSSKPRQSLAGGSTDRKSQAILRKSLMHQISHGPGSKASLGENLGPRRSQLVTSDLVRNLGGGGRLEPKHDQNFAPTFTPVGKMTLPGIASCAASRQASLEDIAPGGAAGHSAKEPEPFAGGRPPLPPLPGVPPVAEALG